MTASQISAAAMERTASLCADSGEALASRLQGLMNELAPMDQDLQGKAGMTFQNVKNTINQEVTTINRVLDDVAEAIRTSGRDIDASDANSDESLRNATGDVDGTSASTQLMGGKA